MEPAKQMLELRRELREIEQIEKRVAAGEVVGPPQLRKIDQRAAILAKLSDATAAAPTVSQRHAVPRRSMSEEIDGGAVAAGVQHHSTSHPAQQFVTNVATEQWSQMGRFAIDALVAEPSFGQRICHRTAQYKISLYNRVALIAQDNSRLKNTNLESKVWSLSWHSEWLHLPINLDRRSERDSFRCIPDVYNYTGAPPGTLVVDFANACVGGGCFGRGLVQEEQMVMQSTDSQHVCMQTGKRCSGTKGSHIKGSTWMLGGPETQLQKKRL
jgi:hypothetical protein